MKASIARFLAIVPLCWWTFAHGQVITLDSSSAAYPLTKRLAEEFDRANAGSRVVARESGSAEALRRLCAKEAQLATVSRPIVKIELARCEKSGVSVVELPVAFDAIAVIVNPRNTFASELSIDQLRRVWTAEAQGKLTRWKQIDPAYPDLPLKLYAPDQRAERGNYFNEAVLGAAREARRDFTASADDDVLVRATARDAHALSYVPLSYYLANRSRVKVVAIAPTAGAPAVLPSPSAIAAGQYQPLSRPLYLYANAGAIQAAQTGAFVEHYLSGAATAARELGYVPLGEGTYQVAQKRLRQRVTGSAWGGDVPVGVTLESLHKRFSAL